MLESGFSSPDFTTSARRNPFGVPSPPSSARSAGVRNVSKRDPCAVAVFVVFFEDIEVCSLPSSEKTHAPLTEHGGSIYKKHSRSSGDKRSSTAPRRANQSAGGRRHRYALRARSLAR